MNTYLTKTEREILEDAKVGIAGAGGLGSNCAMHLVRAGVKRLVIADFDVVSESNLNRQFFFRDQLGMKKVEALKANLLRINPEAEVEIASGAWRLASTEVGTPATMSGDRRLKFVFAPNGVSFVRLRPAR